MSIRKKKILISLLLFLLVLGAYSGYCIFRPVKIVSYSPSSAQLNPTARPSVLIWPIAGQSAIGILGSSSIETHGAQIQTPTASVAKLITSLLVLKLKPLQLGQQGPTITLNASDVAIYNKYLAEQGSVVPVVAGETISEYQMLEAMLLPSANNMADSLAIWAYGSLQAYSVAANKFVDQNGLSKTHIGIDASGYDPGTVSTAHDLILLGELAMQNPVISQIVNQPSATGIPLTVSVKNVNYLLGSNEIIGIKTGNTNQAGGVFVSGSLANPNGKKVIIVTALANAPSLVTAMQYSLPLIQSSHNNFQTTVLVKAGTVVGNYKLPRGVSVPVVATKDLSVTTWNDSQTTVSVTLRPITNKTLSNDIVGTVSAEQLPTQTLKSVAVKLEGSVPQPSTWWRLTHPLS